MPFINLNVELKNADVAKSLMIIQARKAIDDFYELTFDDDARTFMMNHLNSREFALFTRSLQEITSYQEI